jgi:hypothetical protein
MNKIVDTEVRSYRAHWAQLAQILGAKTPDICAQSTPLRPQIGRKYPGLGESINRF